MVEVKKHKTTFWLINEWTSLGWVACFPITDHVKFSREMFFYPCGNRSLIYTRLFENSNARILRVLSDILRWGNKPPELKCAINTAFWSLLGFRRRTDLSSVLALTCLDLHIEKRNQIKSLFQLLSKNLRESPGTKLVLRFLTEPTITNYFQQFEPIDVLYVKGKVRSIIMLM